MHSSTERFSFSQLAASAVPLTFDGEPQRAAAASALLMNPVSDLRQEEAQAHEAWLLEQYLQRGEGIA